MAADILIKVETKVPRLAVVLLWIGYRLRSSWVTACGWRMIRTRVEGGKWERLHN